MKAISNAQCLRRGCMNLPVADVETAIPFYEQTFNLRMVSKQDSPVRSAVLARDEIQIGLVENGGDPTQEGCYFEVDNIEAAYEEIKGAKPLPLTWKLKRTAAILRKSSLSSHRTACAT